MSITEWFAEKEGLESEAGKVFDTTNEIIRKITRYAARISEMSNQGANRKEEYKNWRRCLENARIFRRHTGLQQWYSE